MSTAPPPGKPGSSLERRSMWLFLCLLVPVLLGFAVVKCFESGLREGQSSAGVLAENRTTVTLTLEMPRGSRPAFTLGTLHAGRTGLLISEADLGPNSLLAANGCTKYDVVAYDPEGREVARHGPGLCMGDTWVVEIPASAPSS